MLPRRSSLTRQTQTTGAIPQQISAHNDKEQAGGQWRLIDKFRMSNGGTKGKSTSQVSSVNSMSAESGTGDEKTKVGGRKDTSVKSCCCCGTIVTYPGEMRKFKCSVCQTTNTLLESVTDYDELSPEPHPISSKYVQKVIDKCVSNLEATLSGGVVQTMSLHEIFEPLSNYLLAAFRSYSCLNSSFKIRKSSKKLHYSTSNLDLEDIHLTFNTLTNLPTKRPLYSALYGASKLLRRVEISSDNDPRKLKWLLILLEIPFLSKVLVKYELKGNESSLSMLDVPEIKSLSYDILKRVIGVLAYLITPSTGNYIASWLSKMSHDQFSGKVDLINLYITFHLKKYFYMANNPNISRRMSLGSHQRSQEGRAGNDEYLQNALLKDEIEEVNANEVPSPGFVNIPISQISNSIANIKKNKNKDLVAKVKIHQYGNDWHLKTAAMLLSVLLKANGIRSEGEVFPVNIFYNSLVDFVNLKLDFDSWQSNAKSTNSPKRDTMEPELQTVIDYIHGSKNTFKYDEVSSYFFCQYPYLISLGGKISILEYEARRQMERKAEEAFINSLDKRIAIDVYFRVKVRRDFIVQDSLRCIKLNSTNLKKSLRVQFVNEMGVDAGGLKKEWFLLLTRALFSPQTGMFMNVEDSNSLWFNLSPIENGEMYYLFGAILGLAIYNSTILNLKFPITLYKILLDKAISLSDYEKLYPVAASNLFKLRHYSESELASLDLNFEVSFTDAFGVVHTKELIRNGLKIAVTTNTVENYIEKYAKFFVCDGNTDHIKFFTKGFFAVIGGNALSLFLPEEIQLLLCGSEEEKIDLDIFRSITKYLGWKDQETAENSAVIKWFWEYMESLSYKEHKRFLAFVTGSDRVPATGIQSLQFRISRLAHGRDSNRLPIAHTCFNELALYEYSSKEKFIAKLATAINESSGFGIR